MLVFIVHKKNLDQMCCTSIRKVPVAKFENLLSKSTKYFCFGHIAPLVQRYSGLKAGL